MLVVSWHFFLKSKVTRLHGLRQARRAGLRVLAPASVEPFTPNY